MRRGELQRGTARRRVRSELLRELLVQLLAALHIVRAAITHARVERHRATNRWRCKPQTSQMARNGKWRIRTDEENTANLKNSTRNVDFSPAPAPPAVEAAEGETTGLDAIDSLRSALSASASRLSSSSRPAARTVLRNVPSGASGE